MMKLSQNCLLALLSLLVDLTEADEKDLIGVRALLNEGSLTAENQCDENEFESVKLAIQDHGGARSLRAVNCSRVCCGYAYGTCVVYHRRCRGYPTPTSNRECRRTMKAQRNLEEISVEDCNDSKKSALAAILEAVGTVSPACSNFLLSPTFLECYQYSEYDDSDGSTSNVEDTSPSADCSIEITHTATKWYGNLMIGFNGPSAVLDFAGTAIDPSAVTYIGGDDGVFTSTVVEGTRVVLTADDSASRFLSLHHPVHVHFLSHHSYLALEDLGSPDGMPKCSVPE